MLRISGLLFASFAFADYNHSVNTPIPLNTINTFSNILTLPTYFGFVLGSNVQVDVTGNSTTLFLQLDLLDENDTFILARSGPPPLLFSQFLTAGNYYLYTPTDLSTATLKITVNAFVCVENPNTPVVPMNFPNTTAEVVAVQVCSGATKTFVLDSQPTDNGTMTCSVVSSPTFVATGTVDFVGGQGAPCTGLSLPATCVFVLNGSFQINVTTGAGAYNVSCALGGVYIPPCIPDPLEPNGLYPATPVNTTGNIWVHLSLCEGDHDFFEFPHISTPATYAAFLVSPYSLPLMGRVILRTTTGPGQYNDVVLALKKWPDDSPNVTLSPYTVVVPIVVDSPGLTPTQTIYLEVQLNTIGRNSDYSIVALAGGTYTYYFYGNQTNCSSVTQLFELWPASAAGPPAFTVPGINCITDGVFSVSWAAALPEQNFTEFITSLDFSSAYGIRLYSRNCMGTNQSHCKVSSTNCSFDHGLEFKFRCVTPDDGYFLDNITRPLPCTPQQHCSTSAAMCMTTGDTSKLKCTTPDLGFYLDANTQPQPCTPLTHCATSGSSCLATVDTTKLSCVTPDPNFYLDNNTMPTDCPIPLIISLFSTCVRIDFFSGSTCGQPKCSQPCADKAALLETAFRDANVTRQSECVQLYGGTDVVFVQCIMNKIGHGPLCGSESVSAGHVSVPCFLLAILGLVM